MLEKAASLIWGRTTVLLLLVTGVVYTIRYRFIQFRMFGYIFKNLKKGRNIGPQGRTMCMSLGAAMGTGNITGVAAAIASGGAGAVFWMWFSAFLGMATVYAENSLSAKYSDATLKGPMAYLKKGLGSPALAAVFAICCIFTSFGMGGMIQINCMSESIRECISVDSFTLSAILFIVIYLVISGGKERIGKTAQLALPAASIIYGALCLAVIYTEKGRLSDVFSDIICGAFGIKQAAGGAMGYTVSQAVSTGIRRGIFSNEAGLGSSPLLHSSAEKCNSAQLQGMSSMIEVFIDTMLCCSLTAVTLLCSVNCSDISEALGIVSGRASEPLLAAVLTVFAFCTVIGWYYAGESAFLYLMPKAPRKLFVCVFALIASFGALFRSDMLWTLSDIFNGTMMIPNLIGLIFLFRHTANE